MLTNELELDLGFGVEAYLDSVLIPEYMTDAYQSSLADALGLRVGLEHSSRTLERLGSVINARRSALEAAVEEQSERGNRIFSGLLAVGSVLAVPPALIVGFEALSQATRRSMLDLSSSWSEYLLAWSPFIILILVGYVLRRRVRSTSPLLEIYEETRTAVVPARLSHSVQVRTKIPAPRPGTD